MAARDIVTLNADAEQLQVAQTGDTYSAPRALAITPETLTGSTATPALDIAQTWNTTGTPTGLRLSVTDTASAAVSNLLELRGGAAGTTSLFSVRKDGTLFSYALNGEVFVRSGIGFQASPSGAIAIGGTSGSFNFTSTNNFASPIDLSIFRDDADALAQRRSTTAQTFRVYNATDSITGGAPTNFDRAYMRWSSNVLQIGTEIGGTYGTARPLALQTNGTTRLTLGATDGAATFTGSLTSGPATFNGASSTIASFQDISTGSIFTVNNSAATALLDVTDVTSGNLLSVVNAGGTTVFNVSDVGTTTFVNGTRAQPSIVFAGSTTFGLWNDGNSVLRVSSGNTDWFGIAAATLNVPSGSSINWAGDTYILRDGAANTLAQRNGTNPQTFRIYNTYTTASDYERLEMYWASNIAYVVPTAAGAGTQRNLYIGGSTTKHIRFLPSTNQIDVYPDGGMSVRFTPTSIELGWNIGGSRDITLQPQTGNTNRNSNSLTITADNGVGSGTAGFFRVLSGVVGPSGTAAHALEEVVRHYVIATGEPMASFGGATSSFPAIKRSTTTLQARLADDSTFTNIQGKLTTETNYAAGAPTADGYLVLYDATGTAYKVPAVAL